MSKLMRTAALASALSLLLMACNRGNSTQRFGEAIDSNAPKVTLAELIAKPDTYHGKNVVVDGQFDGKCGDDGDFYFKDKFDIIEADPPAPEVCLLNKGTPVRLFGLVKARHREGESEASVRISAKSVEVLKP